MGKSLSESLSQFISPVEEEVTAFDDPFSDLPDTESNVRESLNRSKEHKQGKKKKKKSKFEKVVSQGDELLDEMYDDALIDDFDGFLEHYFLGDEDVDLKQSLVKYGRQYARDTKSSAESSEVSKAYAKNQDALSKLLSEVEADSDASQKDINMMRMARSRNYKALADMMDIKTQQHNTRLNIIKEMNSMTKNQFDIKMKLDKQQKEDGDDDSTASRAVQQLFGMGRESLMGTFGGYSGISGSDEAGKDSDDIDDFGDVNEDEVIQRKYFSNTNNDETDGDKFIKYEGMGVHYILLYDDDDYREIIAEDKDGNLIPDYPKPKVEDLDFEMSISTGTATDNLAQQYELRHI